MANSNAKELAKQIVDKNLQRQMALKYDNFKSALDTLDKFIDFELKRDRKGNIELIIKKKKTTISENEATTLRCWKNGAL